MSSNLETVHFIGFRTDSEYWSAVKVWGPPDFVHLIHDVRLYGDLDVDNDIVILGTKGRPDPDPKYSWQDHELW